MNEIVLEAWGDFACFTPPWGKVERMTYPFPTPSAIRGLLSAIYSKSEEFYWQVNRIEVLKPIRYANFKRNEVKSKIDCKNYLFADEDRTQRQTVVLRDVRYRIEASIMPRPDFAGHEKQLTEQALRRIRTGKCYWQPSFGLKEFVAYFEESDGRLPPISETLNAGIMVYDIFDLHDYAVRKKAAPKLSLFHAVMENGVIRVPPYDSPEVLKGGAPC